MLFPQMAAGSSKVPRFQSEKTRSFINFINFKAQNRTRSTSKSLPYDEGPCLWDSTHPIALSSLSKFPIKERDCEKGANICTLGSAEKIRVRAFCVITDQTSLGTWDKVVGGSAWLCTVVVTKYSELFFHIEGWVQSKKICQFSHLIGCAATPTLWIFLSTIVGYWIERLVCTLKNFRNFLAKFEFPAISIWKLKIFGIFWRNLNLPPSAYGS